MDLQLAYRVLRLWGNSRERDGWTTRQLQDYQARALLTLREHVYGHSAFYRRFHQGLEERSLAELPVLTKRLLMENFDELVTDPSIRLKDVEAHLAGEKNAKAATLSSRVRSSSGPAASRTLLVITRPGRRRSERSAFRRVDV